MTSWSTIVFCLLFFVLSCRKLLTGRFSVLHIGTIVFFVVQVFPLFVDEIMGGQSQSHLFTNMYKAYVDENVHNIYCIFCCVSISLLYFIASYFSTFNTSSFNRKNTNFIFLLNTLLVVGVLSPLIIWFLAPNPSIYLQFARFQVQSFNMYDVEYLYHMMVMYKANCISFLSVILLYGLNKKNMVCNVFVFLGIVLFSWLDGKRAFLTFALIAIIMIDVAQKRFVYEKYKLVIKSVLFLLISVFFFLIYKDISGKGGESDFYSNYQQYYSRLLCVKTSIYATLYNQPIVEFPGQSLLYDFFFFIPRIFWIDKPVMFCKYFTAFALNRDVGEFLSWNLHVNIWAEYIANLGFLGCFLALAFVSLVARISDQTHSMFVRFWGMMFISLYFMFGFEWLVLIVYLLFWGFLFYDKIKKKFLYRGGNV